MIGERLYQRRCLREGREGDLSKCLPDHKARQGGRDQKAEHDPSSAI
jgi:hypothetical protein